MLHECCQECENAWFKCLITKASRESILTSKVGLLFTIIVGVVSGLGPSGFGILFFLLNLFGTINFVDFIV